MEARDLAASISPLHSFPPLTRIGETHLELRRAPGELGGDVGDVCGGHAVGQQAVDKLRSGNGTVQMEKRGGGEQEGSRRWTSCMTCSGTVYTE